MASKYTNVLADAKTWEAVTEEVREEALEIGQATYDAIMEAWSQGVSLDDLRALAAQLTETGIQSLAVQRPDAARELIDAAARELDNGA